MQTVGSSSTAELPGDPDVTHWVAWELSRGWLHRAELEANVAVFAFVVGLVLAAPRLVSDGLCCGHCRLLDIAHMSHTACNQDRFLTVYPLVRSRFVLVGDTGFEPVTLSRI
jgi:hypothetical protein